MTTLASSLDAQKPTTEPSPSLQSLLNQLEEQLTECTVGATTAARQTAESMLRLVDGNPASHPAALDWVLRALASQPSAAGWDQTLSGLRKVLRPIFGLVADPASDSEHFLLLLAQQLASRPPYTGPEEEADDGRSALAVLLLREEWTTAGLLWCVPLLVHREESVIDRWIAALMEPPAASSEAQVSPGRSSVLTWLLLSVPKRVVAAFLQAAAGTQQPAHVVALLNSCPLLLDECSKSALCTDLCERVTLSEVLKWAGRDSMIELVKTALTAPAASAAAIRIIQLLDRWCSTAALEASVDPLLEQLLSAIEQVGGAEAISGNCSALLVAPAGSSCVVLELESDRLAELLLLPVEGLMLAPASRLSHSVLDAVLSEQPELEVHSRPVQRAMLLLRCMSEDAVEQLVIQAVQRVQGDSRKIWQLGSWLKEAIQTSPAVGRGVARIGIPLMRMLNEVRAQDDESVAARRSLLQLLQLIPAPSCAVRAHILLQECVKIFIRLNDSTNATDAEMAMQLLTYQIGPQPSVGWFGAAIQILLSSSKKRTAAAPKAARKPQLLVLSAQSSQHQQWKSQIANEELIRPSTTQPTTAAVEAADMKVLHIVRMAHKLLHDPTGAQLAQELVQQLVHCVLSDTNMPTPSWAQHNDAISKPSKGSRPSDWDQAVQQSIKQHSTTIPLMHCVASLPNSSSLLMPCLPILRSLLLNLISHFEHEISTMTGLPRLEPQFAQAEQVCRILGSAGWLADPVCRISLAFRKIQASEVAQVLRLVWRYLQLSTASDREEAAGPVGLDESFCVPLRLLLHKYITYLGRFYNYLQPERPSCEETTRHRGQKRARSEVSEDLVR